MKIILLSLILLLTPSLVFAQALELDQNGKLDMTNVDFGVSFEGDFATELNVADAFGITRDQIVSDEGPLAGDSLLVFGGELHSTAVIMDDDIAARFEDRRVNLRFWSQPRGTDVWPFLLWTPTPQMAAFYLPLLLTGRQTSDGWREWSTGPIDFSAGMLPAGTIVFSASGERLADAETPDKARVAVDALTIEDLGPRKYQADGCAFPTEEEDCGPGGACVYGVCVDGVIANGNPPLTVDGRQYNAQRRKFMFDAFGGERQRQGDSTAFEEAFDALPALERADFYPYMRAAIAAQDFGHGGAPRADLTWEPNVGICAMPGVADLLPNSPEAPIVYWVSDRAEFQSLKTGDVLVAVDGLTPLEWAELQPFSTWFEALNGLKSSDLMGKLLELAAFHGSEVTFAHCPRTDGTPCASNEVTLTTIDLAPIVQSQAWTGVADVPDRYCDLRLHQAGGPASLSSMTDVLSWVGSEARDGVGLVALNSYMPTDTDEWDAAVQTGIDNATSAIVFDERFNVGGGLRSANYVADQFIPIAERAHYTAVAWGELGPDELEKINTCLSGMAGTEWYYCVMMVYQEPISDTPAAHGDWPVAFLVSNSASMAEFILFNMASRSAPTRVFGPNSKTPGHLSFFRHGFILDGEVDGGGLQFQDGVYLSGELGGDPNWLSGTGGFTVDEICLQTQSDAVAGTDTCVERAIEWARTQ